MADATVFHAISDPTRRRILDLLRGGERPVSEIMAGLDLPRLRGAGQGDVRAISQPALSQHLGVLRRAGLVEHRKSGRHRLYAVRGEPLQEVSQWVQHFDRFWTSKLGELGRYLDRAHGVGVQDAQEAE